MENNYIKESTIHDILVGNIDKIEESDLDSLKSKIKEVEKRVKEKNKPKTITISGKDHAKIKKYCSLLNLNIGDWVTKVLLKEIDDSSAIIIDNESTNAEILERYSKEIKDRYLTELNANKSLFKSNVIIFNPSFKFQGYSSVDKLPIYDVVKMPENEWLLSRNITLKCVSKSEVSYNISHNMDLEVTL